jgi:hypothetical protein
MLGARLIMGLLLRPSREQVGVSRGKVLIFDGPLC